jgi:hypothetical protein
MQVKGEFGPMEGKITLKKRRPDAEDTDPDVEAYYWFTIAAKNGEIVVASELYKRKGGALKGIRATAAVFSSLFRTSFSGGALAVDDLFTTGKSGEVVFVDETGE